MGRLSWIFRRGRRGSRSRRSDGRRARLHVESGHPSLVELRDPARCPEYRQRHATHRLFGVAQGAGTVDRVLAQRSGERQGLRVHQTRGREAPADVAGNRAKQVVLAEFDCGARTSTPWRSACKSGRRGRNEHGPEVPLGSWVSAPWVPIGLSNSRRGGSTSPCTISPGARPSAGDARSEGAAVAGGGGARERQRDLHAPMPHDTERVVLRRRRPRARPASARRSST